MRRIITVLAVVGLVLAMAALPAAADAPVEFTFGASQPDVDPCTGEDMTVELLFSVKAHEHRNNTVWVIDSYGETSTGYVGTGHETAVTNKNKYVSVFNWVSVKDDGSRALIKGRFLIDLATGEAQHAGVELTCIGRAA